MTPKSIASPNPRSYISKTQGNTDISRNDHTGWGPNTVKFRYYDHLKWRHFIHQLKTLFWKFKLFFSPFSTTSVHLIRDHLWDCPKVVFKTTFGQSQRWSYYRNFTVSLSGYVKWRQFDISNRKITTMKNQHAKHALNIFYQTPRAIHWNITLYWHTTSWTWQLVLGFFMTYKSNSETILLG